MLVAAGTAVSEAVERLVHPITYIMMPLSGAFFMVDLLPPETRELFLLNPQPHIHEALREGMFGDRVTSHFDLLYAASWIVVLNLLGLAAVRSVRPRLEIY
jgi:capsular polysaccharide transport system permease protein